MNGKQSSTNSPGTKPQTKKTEDIKPPQLVRKTECPIKPATITKLPLKTLADCDPQSLLKPAFFEEGPTDPPKLKEMPKKTPVKKMKKRRFSEHEMVKSFKFHYITSLTVSNLQSPPPLILRKGTKSRPNVKMPKHYHNDYEQFNVSKKTHSPPPLIACDVPIKTEPIDIVENNIEYDGKFMNIQIEVHQPTNNPLELAEDSIENTQEKNKTENENRNNTLASSEDNITEDEPQLPKLNTDEITNSGQPCRLTVLDPSEIMMKLKNSENQDTSENGT